MSTKLIAFYLPQFHEIPENDEWWGKGFTEWVNVRKATPFYEWEYQPRVPLNNNYYCLLDEKTQEWQAKIAEEHNVYGFCYYHYWFDGHMLLEKPMENMLVNNRIKLPFCICWANEDWTNAWVSPDAKVLITQNYGDELEWERHYNYLSQFFKDDRYIVENNKPLFVIYRPEIIPCLREMMESWNQMAIKDGFDGICFAYQSAGLDYPTKQDDTGFTYDIEMQPSYGKIVSSGINNRAVKNKIHKILNILRIDWIRERYNEAKGPKIFEYDEIWKTILSTPPISEKSIPCAFVDFDNTSRRKEQGWLFKGVSVDKFKYYFKKILEKKNKEYKSDYMFIFAWNEWAEGGYLEPDELNGYGYLDAIKECIDCE